MFDSKRNIFDRFYKDLEYIECDGIGQTGQANSFKEPRLVKGTIIGGKLVNETTKDGDTTICSLVYKTTEYIVKGSKLDGREVIGCKEIPAFNIYTEYKVYVK